MFKNALIYRIEHWQAPPLPEIESRLAGARFVECAASQPESMGFVEPRGDAHGALLESVGGQLILKLCTETKAVPGSVVKTEVEGKLAEIERDTGRRPRGKIVKQLKEEVVHALLPRAFPKRAHTLVWLDREAGLVLVGATSAKKADKVLTRLVELLGGGLKLSLLQTEASPGSAMAAWLIDKEAPPGFTLDRDCELKAPEGEKPAVRYARHLLEIDEVGAHIREGKLPTRLAMTWNGRVSFELTESMALRKIALLDGVLEGPGRADESGFDTDVAIATGELRRMLPDLVAALGGELLRPAASAAVPGPAGVPVGQPVDVRGDTPPTGVAPWDIVPA